jgi:hypothetical protein
MERMPVRDRVLLRLLPSEESALAATAKPKTRGECANIPRPCPFASCKFNLYLDVTEKTGAIKFNFPHLEPGDMVHSCVLDEADNGPQTLQEVAEKFALVRERVRQIEDRALSKVAPSFSYAEIDGTPQFSISEVYPEGWTEP